MKSKAAEDYLVIAYWQGENGQIMRGESYDADSAYEAVVTAEGVIGNDIYRPVIGAIAFRYPNGMVADGGTVREVVLASFGTVPAEYMAVR